MTITEERTTEDTATPTTPPRRLFKTTEWANGINHSPETVYEELLLSEVPELDRRHLDVNGGSYVAVQVHRDYQRNSYTRADGRNRYFALIDAHSSTQVTRPEEFGLDQINFDLQEIRRANGWKFSMNQSLLQSIMSRVIAPLMTGKTAESFRSIAERHGCYTDDETARKGNALTAEIRKQVKAGWAVEGKDADELRFMAAFAHVNVDFHRYIRAALEAMRKAPREFYTEGGLLAAFTAATHEQGHRLSGTSLRPGVTEYLMTEFPLATPVLPESYAALDAEGVKAELARLYYAQGEFVEALHAEADTRGMCSEFETIMTRVGLPGRPRIYTVQVAVNYKAKVTAQDVQRAMGLTSIDGLPPEMATAKSSTISFTIRAQEKPTTVEHERVLDEAQKSLGEQLVEVTDWSLGDVWH